MTDRIDQIPWATVFRVFRKQSLFPVWITLNSPLDHVYRNLIWRDKGEEVEEIGCFLVATHELVEGQVEGGELHDERSGFVEGKIFGDSHLLFFDKGAG